MAMAAVVGWLWRCIPLLAALCVAESCCVVSWLRRYVVVVEVVGDDAGTRCGRGPRSIADRAVFAGNVVVAVWSVVVGLVMVTLLLCGHGCMIVAAAKVVEVVVDFGFGSSFVFWPCLQ